MIPTNRAAAGLGIVPQAIRFAVREQLADLRIEINTGIADAAALALELGRERGWSRADIADWDPLLDYGFRHAFTAEELPVVALLHLFQGVVDADVLVRMGDGNHALPEVEEPGPRPRPTRF